MIGNSANTNPATLNATVGQLATSWRTLSQQTKDFVTWANALTLAQIETLFGLSAADAATMQTFLGWLTNLEGVYFGTAIVNPAFNFDNALSIAWGGQ